MRLSVFGLGYVGCVSAACFARDGHDVLGVDVNQAKVDMINAGKSPVIEAGVAELICELVAQGKLRATHDSAGAIMASEISLICVGTPSNSDGSPDLTYLKRVCEDIGGALKHGRERHTVVIRSTTLPGTVETVVVPTLELFSDRKAGRDFGICINPEFLREGTSLPDFYEPPFTLIGADDKGVVPVMRRLYAEVHAPFLFVDVKTAEMVKYACNCFHAVKVSFANEMGNICKQIGIDSHKVMDVFSADTKLNLSSYYLKPGFAFGGSCLPKELRAITHHAKELEVEVPLLSAVIHSNYLQIERVVRMVLRTGKARVGVLGVSFKAGTDDMRESPVIALIQKLIADGLRISIYDADVSLARLMGANKEYVERAIPDISQLMRGNIREVLDDAEVLIVGNKSDEFRWIESQLRSDQILIDLVRLFDDKVSGGSYEGICW